MSEQPKYYYLDEMVMMINEPNQSVCRQILYDHRELFQAAPGSTHNHQAWPGGYWDHVTDAMNWFVLFYGAIESTGRLDQLSGDERITLSDGLLVLFLHDIEKPWRTRFEDGELVVIPELKTKAARKEFAQSKLWEYGIKLTPTQENALKYVEGIRDEDYTPDSRIMLPLAALCHSCDLLSARAFYDFPRNDDAWTGAKRITGEQ